MERNDVSFSIPTWRKEEIKSMGMAEEEALYMTSPYNLNDFKNGQQTVQYIFTPVEQPSQLKNYNAKRQMNPRVSKEVGLFAVFLSQIILNDNYFNGKDRLPTTQKKLPEGSHGQKFIGIFKQKIMQMDLCKLGNIPKEFQMYYKNEIIKKIIFQFFGKCIYNISLVEILLTSNDFLRFCIEVCVKSVLFEGTLITKYTENVQFNDEVKMFVDYFAYLFLIRREERAGMKLSEGKPKRMFAYEPYQLKTQHYLLKETKDKKIVLYRKQANLLEIYADGQVRQKSDQNIPKAKQIPQFKLKNAKGKIKTDKKLAENEPRKKQQKGGFFQCCFPCFKNN